MPAQRHWDRIEVRIPSAAEDAFLGLLGPDCLGLETLGPSGDDLRLALYFEPRADPAPLVKAIEIALGSLGIDPGFAALRVGSVPDGRWVERFHERLRPFELGRRFLVVPGEVGPGGEGRRSVVRLVPGRAFGTGEHPTTRMCVEALEARVREGERWLDLGTGTGILAVVAVRCGAARVLARDVDPEAVEVARAVLTANGVRERVDLAVGSAGDLQGSELDGVVANIAAPYFLEHAPTLGRVLRDGGRLIASGFLDGDLEAVGREVSEAGFDDLSSSMDGPWRVLEAVRRGEG